MELNVASYNIRKGVGLDRRRDPERILSVLHEINADVVALQECDRRFGLRAAVLPRQLLDEMHWQTAPVAQRPFSMGWHGNGLLIRRGIEIVRAGHFILPTLEPRGAVFCELQSGKQKVRIVGMHLDLSGLRRRHQIRSIFAQLDQIGGHCPTVLMGDFNEWSVRGGALREFGAHWNVADPGVSFPAYRPVARLDRIVTSREWTVAQCGVHHSALSARASDHLPVYARIAL